MAAELGRPPGRCSRATVHPSSARRSFRLKAYRGSLPEGTMSLIHTCYRITDIDRSVAFYNALGFQEVGRMPIRDEAVNVFMNQPERRGQPAPGADLQRRAHRALRDRHRLRPHRDHRSRTSTPPSQRSPSRGSSPSARRTRSGRAALACASSPTRTAIGSRSSNGDDRASLKCGTWARRRPTSPSCSSTSPAASPRTIARPTTAPGA